MQIAQKLYEGVNIGSETTGLITYMRTDGVQMSMEAMGQLRSAISSTYGDKFVPEKPRFYKSKAANAQESRDYPPDQCHTALARRYAPLSGS